MYSESLKKLTKTLIKKYAMSYDSHMNLTSKNVSPAPLKCDLQKHKFSGFLQLLHQDQFERKVKDKKRYVKFVTPIINHAFQRKEG
jgi:hypothetical protein